MSKNSWTLLPILGIFFLLTGCGDAISKDAHTTFLSADDLVQMTDQMATAIPSDPRVVAVTRQGPMVIVLQPIQNETNEIIVGNEKELYVARVQGLLGQQPQLASQFTFVLNRKDYDKLRATEGVPPTLGAVEGANSRLVPDYALTGTFYAQTNSTSEQRSDYYLCTYRLTKLTGPQTGELLWEGTYSVKKTAKKKFLD